MNNKYIKQEWFLTTEVLPSELPIFFSNLPIKNNLEKLIKLIPTDNKKFNTKFNERYTIPLNFEIPKNSGGYRTISLLHPSSQLKFMYYIMKYEYLLINFLQRSKFNIRKVQKTNTITHNESKTLYKERLKIEQEFGITGSSSITNEELDRYFKKYFAYNKSHKLRDIMNSSSFQRDSLKYRFFSKHDIQNFFGSIYTHSITWAIVGDKHLGKSYRKSQYKNTFAVQSDIIQQKSNDDETNGIILGPEINRIIADIILTHCDYIIEKNLNQQGIYFNKDYKIYRFVDDYYVFSKKYEILEIIEEEISKELSKFNLKLNLEKHQIEEQPFSLSDTPIVQLKQILNAFYNNREINLLKLSKNNLSNFEKYQQLLVNTTNDFTYKISIDQILVRESAWIQLYEAIRDIISTTPNSKRRVTLYFLKTISLKIYEPIFIDTEKPKTSFYRYLKIIYTALEQINNIYSIHLDSDTTKSYINTVMKFRASVIKLRLIINDNEDKFIENSKNYLAEIENRIFENIYRILNNNTNNMTNISDLIVYLKSFDKKLSSQFLCQLLDENKEDYFTLCAVGYYIIGQGKRYKAVLNYLFKLILNFSKNYQTHTKSRLEDAKYFYILNDFIYYPEFQRLETKEGNAKENLQKLVNDELNILNNDKGGDFNPTFYKELMKDSYYDWNLKQIDFEKLQIKKIVTDKNNLSIDDY
ncbi:TPA: RNA-directed DNA polymerase [Streptococcus suis]